MTRAWFLVATLIVCSPRVRADTLGSRLEQPLTEVSHTVDIRIADGVATYTVRRTIANAGAIADEATLVIELPVAAAATGLRVRARTRWRAAELLERWEAASRYDGLTALDGHPAGDPALLEWNDDHSVALEVFPIAPHGRATVEYTLTAPARYLDGRVWVSYPWATELTPPSITVHPAWRASAVVTDGRATSPGVPIGIVHDGRRRPLPDGLDTSRAWIAISPPPIATVTARLGRVLASPSTTVTRLELDAAPRLSRAPAHAAIVFALDAS